ncbi:MAG: hypothetical protein M1819_004714 [Sarea resinae]|nr:MAG: hypothetical protein M1819_004714 [Sarea resinae]
MYTNSSLRGFSSFTLFPPRTLKNRDGSSDRNETEIAPSIVNGDLDSQPDQQLMQARQYLSVEDTKTDIAFAKQLKAIDDFLRELSQERIECDLRLYDEVNAMVKVHEYRKNTPEHILDGPFESAGQENKTGWLDVLYSDEDEEMVLEETRGKAEKEDDSIFATQQFVAAALEVLDVLHDCDPEQGLPESSESSIFVSAPSFLPQMDIASPGNKHDLEACHQRLDPRLDHGKLWALAAEQSQAEKDRKLFSVDRWPVAYSAGAAGATGPVSGIPEMPPGPKDQENMNPPSTTEQAQSTLSLARQRLFSKNSHPTRSSSMASFGTRQMDTGLSFDAGPSSSSSAPTINDDHTEGSLVGGLLSYLSSPAASLAERVLSYFRPSNSSNDAEEIRSAPHSKRISAASLIPAPSVLDASANARAPMIYITRASDSLPRSPKRLLDPSLLTPPAKRYRRSKSLQSPTSPRFNHTLESVPLSPRTNARPKYPTSLLERPSQGRSLPPPPLPFGSSAIATRSLFDAALSPRSSPMPTSNLRSALHKQNSEPLEAGSLRPRSRVRFISPPTALPPLFALPNASGSSSASHYENEGRGKAREGVQWRPWNGPESRTVSWPRNWSPSRLSEEHFLVGAPELVSEPPTEAEAQAKETLASAPPFWGASSQSHSRPQKPWSELLFKPAPPVFKNQIKRASQGDI